MNEHELVKKAQAGDFESFSKLITGHKEKIYALARRLSGNKDDADDIFQETFLKAIDKIDSFRLESSFGTWLYSIALNEARTLFSKRKQSDLKPIEEYLPSKHNKEDLSIEQRKLFDWKDPQKEMEDTELREAIDSGISELPFKYREVFVLRYIEEMSIKEIAKIIKESEASTKSRVLRARLALRDYLSKKFEESYGKKMPRLH